MEAVGACRMGGSMHLPYLSDRKSYEEAAELISLFGDNAGYEAAARADRSRDLGNHIHFCRWRQIERLIVLLSYDQPLGTIH
ncbi:hypothetical protein IQ35_01761 [Sphingobium wenxiniae]|nr:hypothetical protein IQ35_01761 [Sphingobium wenxiniae]